MTYVSPIQQPSQDVSDNAFQNVPISESTANLENANEHPSDEGKDSGPPSRASRRTAAGVKGKKPTPGT